jgi:hypothetical protein
VEVEEGVVDGLRTLIPSRDREGAPPALYGFCHVYTLPAGRGSAFPSDHIGVAHRVPHAADFLCHTSV